MSYQSGIAEQYIGSVFLAHASEDDALVEDIARILEGNGIRAWHDGLTQTTDRAPRGELSAAVRSSDCLVVVLTHASVVKPWIAKEVGMAVMSKKAVMVLTVGDIDVPPHLKEIEVCGSVARLIHRIKEERDASMAAPTPLWAYAFAVVILMLLFALMMRLL
jgi:hypothetical protein